MKKLTNIPLRDFRKFLLNMGCHHIRNSGGHEIWARNDLDRNITLQTHIDPVPVHIIKNTVRSLNMTNMQFLEIMESI